MKINITPDKNKANSLKHMALITIERLQTTDMIKYPSNTLLDFYDTLHKLMEAISINKGIKFKGEGAHQELIDFIFEINYINEQNRQLLQQLRTYRNRISYEGFSIKENYIEQNIKQIELIIENLKK